ncbi:PepSY domain-containing protein [Echinicola sp. 20G]|uniref:PepSY domain-containing protein n=1 Tax=Echinicola sp. 20G TaxID=2781961 RepID=UPI001910368F|nr:PepSY domain-containing protein [Echinicola sp. 20G]
MVKDIFDLSGYCRLSDVDAMVRQLWRTAHFMLALIASGFLIIASVTGAILGFNAAVNQSENFSISRKEKLTLLNLINNAQYDVPAISVISLDESHNLQVVGLDEEWNSFTSYYDPVTGDRMEDYVPQSNFITWVTALHRSLFLHQTGRWLIGLTSFLLILIAISGFALVVKRSSGSMSFFKKVARDSTSQYLHTVLGKWSLAPVLIVAASGAYLFLSGIGWLGQPVIEHDQSIVSASEDNILTLPDEIEFFKRVPIEEFVRLEFPFTEEPEDFYKLELQHGEYLIDQYTGEVVSQVDYPTSTKLVGISQLLHTGRGSLIWSIVLGFSALNILYFIYSGTVIAYHRKKVRYKNPVNISEAEIVILVGSENGSTRAFANSIHRQLLTDKRHSYIMDANDYHYFPAVQELLIFTSTHGQGEAPSSATHLKKLILKYPQNMGVKFSVVGFGSKSYPAYCRFAHDIDTLMEECNWSNRTIRIHEVNDKSPKEFSSWVALWKQEVNVNLSTSITDYQLKAKRRKRFQVLENHFDPDDNSFLITLRGARFNKFQSGDLIAVYPNNEASPRMYSIGKRGRNIQLAVKLIPNGLASSFLYSLQTGDSFKGEVLSNVSFHQPNDASGIIMICNGTGIAPFVGMMSQNINKVPMFLFAGFRRRTKMAMEIEKLAKISMQEGGLTKSNFAYSREENRPNLYVMDLINSDEVIVSELLNQGGVIMICGSLAMQASVENTLDEICKRQLELGLDFFKKKGQIRTDCY